MLETLTDNRNRTVSDIRSTFTKSGGNLAESGAVAWQFQQRAVVVVEAEEEEAEELTPDRDRRGSGKTSRLSDSTLHVYSAPAELEEIRERLSEHDATVRSSDTAMLPKNTITSTRSRPSRRCASWTNWRTWTTSRECSPTRTSRTRPWSVTGVSRKDSSQIRQALSGRQR